MPWPSAPASRLHPCRGRRCAVSIRRASRWTWLVRRGRSSSARWPLSTIWRTSSLNHPSESTVSSRRFSNAWSSPSASTSVIRIWSFYTAAGLIARFFLSVIQRFAGVIQARGTPDSAQRPPRAAAPPTPHEPGPTRGSPDAHGATAAPAGVKPGCGDHGQGITVLAVVDTVTGQ